MANLEDIRTRSSKRSKISIKNIFSKEFLDRRRDQLITLSLVVAFFTIWETLAQARLISAIIFPAPSRILSNLVEALVTGKYLDDMMISITRLLSGFLVGGGSGLLLGMLMGWSKRIRSIADPIIAALHPIPKFALLPMVIIIFGLGETSRTAMVSIGAFFPMLINSMAGVLEINPTHYEVVENYGANKLDIFRKVVLPGSLPLIMTGARLSLKASLTITVGVEMVFSNTGLGSVLWLAWETMRMVDLYSVILIVSIIGFGTNFLLEKSKSILVPWHQELRPSE